MWEGETQFLSAPEVPKNFPGEEVKKDKKLKEEEEGRNELKEEEEKVGYVANTKNKKQTWLLGKVLPRRRRRKWED